MDADKLKEYLEQKICDLGQALDVSTAMKVLRSRAHEGVMEAYHYGQAISLSKLLTRINRT